MVNLGQRNGSIQSGLRPAIILQNNIGNKYSPTTLVCPLTSKTKKRLPTHVVLNPEDCGILKQSVVLCEQLTVVDKAQISNKVGEIKDTAMIESINKKIMISLDL